MMSLIAQQYELAQMRHSELLADAQQRHLSQSAIDTEPNPHRRQPIALRLNHLVITISFAGKSGGVYETR
jgi:hypothetical protein